MKTEILRCSDCHAYTVKEICPTCKNPALSPKPAKFSIEDKWGRYRRMAKTALQEAESKTL